MSVHYGHLVRILHWCTDQSMTNALEEMDLTAAQGHIMGFLAHSKEPPCPRDVEEKFHLSHPTVSGLLSRLEKKEFIHLKPDEHDRRKIILSCTRKAKAMLKKAESVRSEYHEIMTRGISQEDFEAYRRVMRQVEQNINDFLDETP